MHRPEYVDEISFRRGIFTITRTFLLNLKCYAFQKRFESGKRSSFVLAEVTSTFWHEGLCVRYEDLDELRVVFHSKELTEHSELNTASRLLYHFGR